LRALKFWPYLLRSPPENSFQRIDIETLRSTASGLLAKWLQPHGLIPEGFGLPACGADKVDLAEIERHRYNEDNLREVQASIENLSHEQQSFIHTTTYTIECGNACLYYYTVSHLHTFNFFKGALLLFIKILM
jgi:hypothetical protein